MVVVVIVGGVLALWDIYIFIGGKKVNESVEKIIHIWKEIWLFANFYELKSEMKKKRKKEKEKNKSYT